MPEDNLPKDGPGTVPAAGPDPIAFNQWSAHIPTELKDKGYWEPVKDQPLATVLKNYGHAQERMGKSIVIPDKEDKDGWSKIYNKLGRPESPDKYQYELPQKEGLKWDEETFKSFTTVMHQLGASNDQVKGVVDWFTKDIITKNDSYFEQSKAKAEDVTTKLKKELGSGYDSSMALARRAAETYLGAEAGKDYVDRNITNESVVRGFIKLGKDLAEDGAFGKKPQELEGVISREAATQKILQIMSNRSHPYWGNPGNPETQAALAEMEDLHKIAYPE